MALWTESGMHCVKIDEVDVKSLEFLTLQNLLKH